MTPYAWAWLLSLSAAALFFAAGLFFARHRSATLAETLTRRESSTGPDLAQQDRALPLKEVEREDPLAVSASQVIARVEPPLFDHDMRSDTPVSGDMLRAVLERESVRSDLTGAVIADELGLVVASTGELSDALAAYGAVLAGIGQKTRDAIPFHDVRQVVVTDDHDMTLTVRKIAAVDEEFALVTLTAGHNNMTAHVAPGR